MIRGKCTHNGFICVLFLALLLLTSLPVEAQSHELISIDSKQAEVGDYFTSNIYVSNFEDVQGINCILFYNPDIIEYVAAGRTTNFSNIDLFGTSVTANLLSPGELNIVATNVDNITVSDPRALIEIYFQAKNNGTSDLEFQEFPEFSKDFVNYSMAFTNGKVRVGSNSAPLLDTIGPKSVNEGDFISFTVSASDADGDELTYSAVGLPAGATFNETTRTFAWTPSFSSAASHMFIINVFDGQSSDQEIVTITVNNVDRAPELDAIGDKSVDENALLSFTISATDPDGDTVTYSAVGLPTDATLDATTGDFSWTPDYDSAGTYDVEFIATANSLTDSETITITIDNVDRAPELDAIGDKAVDENELLSFTISATDSDGDEVSYSAIGLPTDATLDATTGDFSWIPDYDSAGTYDVEFVATSNGLTDSETITISVGDVDRPPELAAISDKSVDETELLSFTISATDPDGDEVAYSAVGLPTGATLDATTGDFSWTPDYDSAGTYDVEFIATANGLTDSETITITVNNVDREPVLDAIGDKTVDENEVLSFTISAIDPDGDEVSYSAVGLPTGATLDVTTGDFSWTPGSDDSGSYDVEFIATANSLDDSEIITISVGDVDRPPVLDVIGDKAVNENELLSFTISATDPDGDEVTYSAVGLPTGANLDATTGAFDWTPGFDDSGSYSVEFIATANDQDDSEIITITVANVNRAPVLDAIGDKAVDENELLSFTVSATDPDSDAVTYSAAGLPSGATFDTTTGDFSWMPGYDDSGLYSVTFSVSDGELSDSEAITITVDNVDRAPELASIGDKSVSENELLSFTISATDPDSDEVSYSAVGLPDGAALDSITGDFSWTPDSDDAGNYDVEFIATANGLDDSEIITITVGDVDRPPVLDAIGDKAVNENELLSFTTFATDPDGDEVSYSAVGLPGGATLDATTGAFDWTPGFDDAGAYSVEFIANDNALTDSETIIITVANVDRAPELDAIGDKCVTENELLSFTISATDPDGDAVTYSAVGLPTGATLDATSGAFDWTPGSDDSGSYDVEFIATANGLDDSKIITITVEEEVVIILPVADFTADVISGNAPLTVQFTDQSSNAESWSWDVDGDGVEDGNTRDFSYTYVNSGTYNVSLRVTNADGADTETKQGYITVNDASELFFSMTDNAEKVTLGTELVYEITLTNTKNVELTHVQVVDVLPAGLEFVSASGTTFDEITNTVVLEMGTLLPGETKIAQIVVRTTAFGPIENSATMICDQQETAISTDLTTVVSQEEIPEFPTVAIPMLAVFGLAFVFMRRRE